MDEPAGSIRSEIEREGGVISFARFMEIALYHPDRGYYERHSERVGSAGDFYTSVQVGDLFGRLLGFQFASWLPALSTKPWQIVETGAHNGRLAADILAWFERFRPELLNDLEYWIIEPSERRRIWQKETLARFGERVRWFESWNETGPASINGVIFSNELLDAFPVQRWGWDATRRRWFEWGVGIDGERFVWKQLSEQGTEIAAESILGERLPEGLLAVLPDGYVVESSPSAVAWWRAAAQHLRQGWLMTFDYGGDVLDLLSPERTQGTLRAYSRHRVSDDLLANPGQQDLTAHVNFTMVKAAGAAAGLQTQLFESQAHFMTRIAAQAWKPDSRFGEWLPQDNRQFQTLTHPEHLGRPFKVLVQAR